MKPLLLLIGIQRASEPALNLLPRETLTDSVITTYETELAKNNKPKNTCCYTFHYSSTVVALPSIKLAVETA